MTSDEELWRVFRLYMSGLSDAELETIAQQLAKESTARREHDAYPARLLFSSLTMADLEAAHDQIQAEQRQRAEDALLFDLPVETDAHAAAALAKAAISIRICAHDRENSLAREARQSDECDDPGRGRGQKEKHSQMPVSTITDDNNITAFTNAAEAAANGNSAALAFESEQELARVAADWPMSRLVEIYNSIPGQREIQRFLDRRKAVKRIWDAVQPLARGVTSAPPSTDVVDATGAAGPLGTTVPRAKRKPAAPSRTRTVARKQPKKAAAPKQPSRGGKKAAVVAMLKRPKGVSLADIMASTGWQAHTVRGMISILGSRGGVNIESSKNASGERRYRITP